MGLPSRLGWPIANRPQVDNLVDNLPHNDVCITFGGPQAHGHSLTRPRDRTGCMSGCMMDAMTPTCLFCRIADGTLPAAKVYEAEDVLAFLDTRPLFAGHCLLIPRPHFETLTDLPPDRVAPLFAMARLLAAAVEEALAADGSFVAINNRVSQSVPHLHVHIVPRRRKDGMKGFFWPRRKYQDDNELENTRLAINKTLKRLL